MTIEITSFWLGVIFITPLTVILLSALVFCVCHALATHGKDPGFWAFWFCAFAVVLFFIGTAILKTEFLKYETERTSQVPPE